jgi:hypothetical protein
MTPTPTTLPSDDDDMNKTIEDVGVPLRDPDELEGTLLFATDVVPIVEITEYEQQRQSQKQQHELPIEAGSLLEAVPVYASDGTTAPPVDHNDRRSCSSSVAKEHDDDSCDEEARVLPSYPNASKYIAGDRRAAAIGTHRGRVQARGEREVLGRTRRAIPVRNRWEQRNIRQANCKALQQNRKEETGQVQTSWTIPQEKQVASSSHGTGRPPEFYQGTYGKPYETEEYATREYDTSTYETSEYKSVYETSSP